MDFLLFEFATKPVWMWLAFLGVVVALLAFDLGVLHRDDHEIGVRESLLLSALYVAMGLLFGAWVWTHLGPEAGMEYLTGFVVEKSLAMEKFPPAWSLTATFAILAAGVAYSLWKTRRESAQLGRTTP